MSQSALTNTQMILFFIKHFPGCYKPVVSFQISDKVDSDSPCQFIHCFCGGTNFWSYLLHHFSGYHSVTRFSLR